ncbi:MAG: type II toxin-antitoxin system VapC family toxin [Planctomycetaceae bacterium]|nr:type II toxin-antitoxin system VapC family toxin [Planctomycetaceae bacterium]
MLTAADIERYFSAASIWEVSIKSALNRREFKVDARVLRRHLLDSGCIELAVDGMHAAATSELPAIHKDPFDRVLVAQAMVEGITILTADSRICSYPAPTRLVQRQSRR